jgi:glycosyltransferase involved in cell wall biosynthesis
VLLPERLSAWYHGGKLVDDIWTYVPFGLVPIANQVLFRSRWAIENAWRFFMPPLKGKLTARGFGKVHTLWIDSPIFGFLLDMIPHEISVLRIADELSGFPELGTNIIEAEKSLIQKVDLVVATARNLEKKAAELGAKKTLFLPNGVDLINFSGKRLAEPADLAAIPAPRAVYVGAIERWFNAEWIAFAASRLTNVSFVIIGQYEPGTFPDLERLPNVFLLGKRAYETVPAYLAHSQVGLIPFRQLPFIDSVNPIKLYEYMACGLPVVATRWKTLEEAASPALLAANEEEFTRAIQDALRIPPEQKERFVRFATANSWTKRFDLVKGHLT